MNKTIITGRLGADADLIIGNDGKNFLRYRVAVDERNNKGEKTVTWFQCKQNFKEGSKIGEYLKKGTLVYIEGRVGAYNKEGNEWPVLTLYVFTIELLSAQQRNNNNDDPF